MNATANGVDSTITANFGCYPMANGVQGAVGWFSTANDPMIHTAITDAVTLEEAGTLNFDCVNATVGEVALVQFAYMTAIQVDEINPTPDV